MNRREVLASAAAVGVAGVTALPAAATRLDIPAELGASAQFLPLVDALIAADMIGDLRARGPFTVFAPTIAAFERLGLGTLAALQTPAQRPVLRQILGFHVVPGYHSVFELMGRETRLVTSIGRPIIVDGRRTGPRIGSASLGLSEVAASNGVIHHIDRVLRPG